MTPAAAAFQLRLDGIDIIQVGPHTWQMGHALLDDDALLDFVRERELEAGA